MTTCNCEPKLKLRCENVSKTFIQKGNQEVPVIRDVTLDVYENEFLVILGPGQCGKSTLLKIDRYRKAAGWQSGYCTGNGAEFGTA